jgi:hypothetical protein
MEDHVMLKKIRSQAPVTAILMLSAFSFAADEQILFDFGSGFDVNAVQTTDAAATLTPSHALRVRTGREKTWPGITLKAPQGKWDLSRFEYLKIDVRNLGSEPLTLNCRVDNPGADGTNNCVTDSLTLAANARDTLIVRLYPTPWVLSRPVEIIGMRGWPKAPDKLDPANVTQLLFFVTRPKTEHTFEIDNIIAAGRVNHIDADKLFPMIDEFGQFIHADWPGKTHSLAEFQSHRTTESKDLAANPGPADRNQYGGWTAGPQLKATGFFRVEKHAGKWWLVDPDGRLFWSHGIDCVRAVNDTPITDREHYFRNLPAGDSPFASFYGRGSWAPHGYYNTHSPYRTYDFSRANLLRKYGPTWSDDFAAITHRRLKSWGLNTIANWSDSAIYLMRKTPYTGNIGFSAKPIEGSEGYWGKFPDPFDAGFRNNLRASLEREKGRSLNDPWCIGYFVHNELGWGDETSLAIAALQSPADQPAKLAFLEVLKTKYQTIDKLNAAWGTQHASWQALLETRQAPDRQKASDDLKAFYTTIAETYFKTIRDEIKRQAPNQMYMGCRFAWVNDRAARAAAKYCDIVCYNCYTYSVADLRLPGNIDVPIIVGEFHFGALDRGMFHTGLRKTISQQDRADKYTAYVQGALRNPCIVGTHWFQYKDQATTGRGDGENYQIGFIDICNTPYPEIVAAARNIGKTMYTYRLQE